MAEPVDQILQPDPGSAQREELTAYIDGELDGPASARVEQRLASDPAYRAELTRLEQVWDCLDVLPQTQVDDGFTRTTIAMVTLAASQEIAEQRTALPRRERRRQLVGAASVLGCLFAGFLLCASLWPDPNRALIHDLPVIEHLDLYQNADSVEFLRMLRAAQNQTPPLRLVGVSDDLSSVAAESSRTFVLNESTAARRARIAALTPEAKARLRVNQERFLALSATERERVLSIERQIAADGDAAALLHTLDEYHEWLKQLSPGQRADLADLKPAERVRAIRKLVADQERQRATDLSPQDKQAILGWFEEFVVDHRRQILAGLAEQPPESFDKLDERRQRGALMTLAVQKFQRLGAQVFTPTEAEAKRLTDRLSPQARAQLKSLPNQEEQKRQIALWLRSALRSRVQDKLGGPSAASSEQLEQFFDQRLSSDERGRLLSMSSEEMQRELRELYARENGPAGPWLPGGRFRDPPPPGPEPRDGGPRDGGPRDGGPRRGGPGDGRPRDGGPPHEGGPHPPRGGDHRDDRDDERGGPRPPRPFGRPGEGGPRGPGPRGPERDGPEGRKFDRGPEDGPDRNPPPPRE